MMRITTYYYVYICPSSIRFHDLELYAGVKELYGNSG